MSSLPHIMHIGPGNLSEPAVKLEWDTDYATTTFSAPVLHHGVGTTSKRGAEPISSGDPNYLCTGPGHLGL